MFRQIKRHFLKIAVFLLLPMAELGAQPIPVQDGAFDISSPQARAGMLASGFLREINDHILFPLITFLVALALLFFLYGVFEYARGANNPSERERGRRHIIYGVIGMVIMLSAAAILNIAANTFGL